MTTVSKEPRDSLGRGKPLGDKCHQAVLGAARPMPRRSGVDSGAADPVEMLPQGMGAVIQPHSWHCITSVIHLQSCHCITPGAALPSAARPADGTRSATSGKAADICKPVCSANRLAARPSVYLQLWHYTELPYSLSFGAIGKTTAPRRAGLLRPLVALARGVIYTLGQLWARGVPTQQPPWPARTRRVEINVGCTDAHGA